MDCVRSDDSLMMMPCIGISNPPPPPQLLPLPPAQLLLRILRYSESMGIKSNIKDNCACAGVSMLGGGGGGRLAGVWS